MQEFKADNEIGKILHDWWAGLEDNKGDRAALRRCGEAAEVVFVPAYHGLHAKLRRFYSGKDAHLPVVAGLVAHVKSHTSGKLPEQMAQPKIAGGKATLSELRFRRLLQYQSQEELFPALRRVVQLLGGNVDLYSLANSAQFWNDKTRRDWAYAYYGALKD